MCSPERDEVIALKLMPPVLIHDFREDAALLEGLHHTFSFLEARLLSQFRCQTSEAH